MNCGVCCAAVPPGVFADESRYACEKCRRMYGPCCASSVPGLCLSCRDLVQARGLWAGCDQEVPVDDIAACMESEEEI